MPGGFLKSLFPGEEPAVAALRAQLLQAVSTPGLTTLVLQGPPGTGKTTIARAVAGARMLAMVDHARLPVGRERLIDDVRRGRPLKWYRDLSLAGLSPTLADVQLFGVVKAYATDVKPRIGIFERTMTGSLKEFDDEPHRKIVEREAKVDIIPRLTGGVVLLDEIGDLNAELQAKLLRVLNGEVQYRLGGEGNNDFGFSFRGLVVLATWRQLGDQVLRPDLRQRLLQNRIQVPSLSEYSPETSPLTRGRGLKLPGRPCAAHAPQSPLTRGRGLKHERGEIGAEDPRVAPHAGAWIETFPATPASPSVTCRPSRGGVD
jgi:MoxR-like ATPase